MKIVLDTNVLVSGLLSPYGAPGKIIQMVVSGTLNLCYDTRILFEYRSVLLRPKFSFAQNHVDDLIEQIKFSGYFVSTLPLHIKLPDPDDEPFLEVAISGNADYLVTGNIKHFPQRSRQKIKVVLPKVFLKNYYETF